MQGLALGLQVLPQCLLPALLQGLHTGLLQAQRGVGGSLQGLCGVLQVAGTLAAVLQAGCGLQQAGLQVL